MAESKLGQQIFSKIRSSHKETLQDANFFLSLSCFFCSTAALFEKDKFIFKTLVAFKVLQHAGDIIQNEMDFLLKCPGSKDSKSPVDFLTDIQWGTLKVSEAKRRNIFSSEKNSSKTI